MTAASPTISRGGSKLRLPNLRWVRRGVSLVALLALWQVSVNAGWLDDRTLASPTEVASAFGDLVSEGTLGHHLLISLRRAALGLLFGGVLAVVLAALTGLSRFAEEVFDAPIQMARTLPHLGLVPLFILWFGIGEEPKIVLVALGVAFPLYLNVHSGIRNVDDQLIEATTALGFTRWERLWHVILPAAVPQTLVGLRQSLGIAWLALIVGETVNADAGLGYLINNAREFLRTDVIVVGLVVYAVLGLVTDALVRLLERRALRWRKG
jgi:sulfonate transport system permease protein